MTVVHAVSCLSMTLIDDLAGLWLWPLTYFAMFLSKSIDSQIEQCGQSDTTKTWYNKLPTKLQSWTKLFFSSY